MPQDLYCRYLTAKRLLRLRDKPLPHAAKHVHFWLQAIVEEAEPPPNTFLHA